MACHVLVSGTRLRISQRFSRQIFHLMHTRRIRLRRHDKKAAGVFGNFTAFIGDKVGNLSGRRQIVKTRRQTGSAHVNGVRCRRDSDRLRRVKPNRFRRDALLRKISFFDADEKRRGAGQPQHPHFNGDGRRGRGRGLLAATRQHQYS